MQEFLITTLNLRMSTSPFLIQIIPILADIFVFSYPVYLIYLYFSQIQTSRWQKIFTSPNNKTNKYNALTIVYATITAIIINYIVKFFVTEQRPYHTLDLSINPQESLILNQIPTDSFPSDHAAVGTVIAISTLILWYRYKNKNMILTGWIFVWFSIIMDISRITLGLHRPADILWGIGVGLCAAVIITYSPINNYLTKNISSYLVRFQEYVFNKINKA